MVMRIKRQAGKPLVWRRDNASAVKDFLVDCRSECCLAVEERKQVIEEFCPRFTPGAVLLYVGDAENKFLHLDAKSLSQLGVTAAAAKMPDVVVFDSRRNWLVLIEAVTSAGPVDGKRRKELKELFAGSTAGLVFVTAFSSRDTMRSFLSHISWETESGSPKPQTT